MIKSFIGKSKHLTKRNKKSTMRDDGVMSFLGLFRIFYRNVLSSLRRQGSSTLLLKSFRRFKKIFSRSLRSLFLFSSIVPHKGRKGKVVIMTQKFFASKWGKLGTALAVLALVAACGGGGDSAPAPGVNPPPQPVSVTKTVTCPNGSPQSATAATADAAISAAAALCAQPKLISVTPANGTTGVNLDGQAPFSVVVATDSALILPASGDVSLKAGLTPVAGSVALVGTNSFKLTPSAKLLYGQVYTFAANMKDALGRAFSVTSTFTASSVSCVSPKIPSSDGQSCVNPTCTAPSVWSGTSCEVPPATCTAPAMANSLGACVSPPAGTGYSWNSVIKAWVADIGTLVVGANTLPATCVTFGDACWTQSVANGTIKFANSNVRDTVNSARPVVFAFYRAGAGSAFPGVYMSTPMYADVAGEAALSNQNTANGGNGNVISNVKGSAGGVKQTISDGCWEKVWDAGGAWVNHSISCPI